jgi:hypothetical protein
MFWLLALWYTFYRKVPFTLFKTDNFNPRDLAEVPREHATGSTAPDD